MHLTDSSAPTRAQAETAKNQTGYPPQPAELQAYKLRQRFGLAPEIARTLASIVFAVEARQ